MTGPDDVLAHLGQLGAARAVGVHADALRDDLVLVLVEVVAQIEQQLPRRQRLAGGRGGTLRRAAPALGAAEHVEHLLPGELVDARRAVADGVLVVLRLGELPERLELLEEHVGQRRDDVEVLGDRQEVEHHEDRQVVHPPGEVAGRHGDAHAADRRHHLAHQVREGLPAGVAGEGGDAVPQQLAAVVDEPRERDHADAAEDDVRLPVRVVAVALLGRRVAEQAARLRDEPAREQDHDAHEDDDLEEIAHEPVERAEQPGREREEVEVGQVGPHEHGDDLDAQDRRSPRTRRSGASPPVRSFTIATSGRMNFFCPKA